MAYFKLVATWSKAGVGTCILAESNIGTKLAFDMGCTPIIDQAVEARHVFISHGHIDHVAGIFGHARSRAVLRAGAPPPTYFVPQALLQPLEQARQAMSALDSMNDGTGARNQSLVETCFVGVKPGDVVPLGHTKGKEILFAHVFGVSHGGHPAVGYVICRQLSPTLKSEYQGLHKNEIRRLVNEGVDIKNPPTIQPEIAYTGDTTCEALLRTDDIHLQQAFQAPLLLCELTYLDKPLPDQDLRGHTWLSDVATILECHKCQNRTDWQLVFFHLSAKYSLEYALDCLLSSLPQWIINISAISVQATISKSKRACESVIALIKPNGCISLLDYQTFTNHK